jgi:hypothetical protein
MTTPDRLGPDKIWWMRGMVPNTPANMARD